MKNKSILIFILFVILAVGIGVGVYFVTNSKNNTQETSGKVELNNEENEKVLQDEQGVQEKKQVVDFAISQLSEKEKQILERYSNNNDYKVIPISRNKFKGYLVAIYEPERIHVVASSKIGTSGEFVTKMVKDNNAILGINAGGFADPNFDGDGGTPLGITITKNRMITTDKYSTSRGGIIGFNAKNKLVLET